MTIPEASQVFTIGHSNHQPEVFLELLQRHRVEAVADVRSAPFSRFNPQFNRERIEAFLKEHGLHYVFLGDELGARTKDRTCYVRGRVQYGRLAQTALFTEGLNRVLQGARHYRIALMCAEKEPLECHRTLLVAKALVTHGMPVTHIHADGHLETYREGLERLLEITGIARGDLFRSHEELLEEALKRREQEVAYVDEALVEGITPEARKPGDYNVGQNPPLLVKPVISKFSV
ncbi:MAG: DUF488 domain-containing protein [Chthoniobacteraceae bacterium]